MHRTLLNVPSNSAQQQQGRETSCLTDHSALHCSVCACMLAPILFSCTAHCMRCMALYSMAAPNASMQPCQRHACTPCCTVTRLYTVTHAPLCTLTRGRVRPGASTVAGPWTGTHHARPTQANPARNLAGTQHQAYRQLQHCDWKFHTFDMSHTTPGTDVRDLGLSLAHQHHHIPQAGALKHHASPQPSSHCGDHACA